MNTAKLNPQSKNYFRALAAVIITGMAAFSMEYCLQPVISKIAATFELNPAQASLAVSAAMIGMALTLFVLTSFADRLPRRASHARGQKTRRGAVIRKKRAPVHTGALLP